MEEGVVMNGDTMFVFAWLAFVVAIVLKGARL